MKLKRIYCLAEGKPLSAGRKKNECRNERYPVGVESELHGRAELREIRCAAAYANGRAGLPGRDCGTG